MKASWYMTWAGTVLLAAWHVPFGLPGYGQVTMAVAGIVLCWMGWGYSGRGK